MSVIRTTSGVQGTLGFQEEIEVVESATVVRLPGSTDKVETARITERMVRRHARRSKCSLSHLCVVVSSVAVEVMVGPPNPTGGMVFCGRRAISVIYL